MADNNKPKIDLDPDFLYQAASNRPTRKVTSDHTQKKVYASSVDESVKKTAGTARRSSEGRMITKANASPRMAENRRRASSDDDEISAEEYLARKKRSAEAKMDRAATAPVRKDMPVRDRQLRSTASGNIQSKQSLSQAGSQPGKAYVNAGQGGRPVRNSSSQRGGAANYSSSQGGRPARTSGAASGRPQANQNRPQGNRQHSHNERPVNSSARRYADQRTGIIKEEPKKKLPIFWICVGVYALILIICAWRFLAYTDKCLEKYEQSQSENAMNGILEEFKGMVNDGSVAEQIALTNGNIFEDSSAYKQIYLSNFEGVKSYSFKKSESSYLTEAPVYDIFADENLKARITLKPENERKIFGILTIMDWKIDKIEPAFSMDTHDYTIITNSSAKVYVNNIEVTKDYQTGEPEIASEYKNVAEYFDMPASVKYVIKGLVNVPVIEIADASGNREQVEIGENNTVTRLTTVASSEMPKELEDMAYKMAQTWQNFVTADLPGAKYGLDTIQKYLIKDSYYWKYAAQYAAGPDITFISNHTLLDPAYTNKVIDNYVSYGENCFSCHISFEKNMKLTRTGQKVVDKINSTFYFVKYDDSEDGVDNPHWAIVDMIATTN